MTILWKQLSDTYKILISMLLFIMLIQLGTLIYIWKYESEILLDKERKNLSYQLDVNCKRLETYMSHLQKELEFLSILEVMDDIMVNDIDKRITVLLEKKAKDLSQGIIIEAFNNNDKRVSSSKQDYNSKEFLEFQIAVYTSFSRKKKIGHLSLLYPFKNLTQLSTENPYQTLWLQPSKKLKAPLFKKNHTDSKSSIVVSTLLKGKLEEWRLSLSYKKKYALESIEEIEQILLFAFALSVLLLLFVVWVLSKKQIEILEHTQEVLALKRTFLSTMSHELRTPLGSILNLTQHLMVSPRVGDDEVEMLGRIENSSEHLLEMINNLLQLSKLESNSMHVNKERIDVRLVIEEVIEMVEPLIYEKELDLKKNIGREELFIFTDINLFKQVIINLLSNAIKFTQKGSIEISLTQNEDAFIFKVIDTGVGIAKEKQESLFCEFYQAHSTEIKHSTGLGLALSQKVAQLIYGKIEIQSKGIGFGVKALFNFRSLES
jgi:signal transduction histidine kinase